MKTLRHRCLSHTAARASHGRRRDHCPAAGGWWLRCQPVSVRGVDNACMRVRRLDGTYSAWGFPTCVVGSREGREVGGGWDQSPRDERQRIVAYPPAKHHVEAARIVSAVKHPLLA